MASALASLREIVPPPAGSRPGVDWKRVEATIGSPLPHDYKDLVETYGPGVFDDFVWVLHPEVENPTLNLLAEGGRTLDALRTLRASERIPYVVERGTEELLPWGRTDDGDKLYWVTKPRYSPDDWTVVVNEARGPTWETFDGTATELLYALLRGSVRLDLFDGSDFPSTAPQFEPDRTS